MKPPHLESLRLVLRPFTAADAADVQRLAGEYAIADTTLNIPHPYEDGMAEDWIATHQREFEAGKQVTLAVTLRDTDQLIGAIGLIVERRFDSAELGYWVGKPFWNKGYCTEAAVTLMKHGFDEVGLNRIAARHLARNPASGRVMEKAGMQREGVARQATKKWDSYEDMLLYAALRDEWSAPG